MTDREKVIKGLECCHVQQNEVPPLCEDCPYINPTEGTCDALDELLGDALTLLKAQEPRVMTIRPIDADALYEAIEDHVTTVSVCPTAEYAHGKTEFKRICLEEIKNAPTIDVPEPPSITGTHVNQGDGSLIDSINDTITAFRCCVQTPPDCANCPMQGPGFGTVCRQKVKDGVAFWLNRAKESMRK